MQHKIIILPRPYHCLVPYGGVVKYYGPKQGQVGRRGISSVSKQGKGQRAARTMLVQHKGPAAFLKQTSTFASYTELSAAKTKPTDRSESAAWRQKLPRISAVGSNCVRYTVRLAQRGAGPKVRYHKLPNPDGEGPILGDRVGKSGKKLERSSRVLPSNPHSVHTEAGFNRKGEQVTNYFWAQNLGQRWLLTATLFGERVITTEFTSKKSAMLHAEAHAGQTLAWANSRGRGKRARRSKRSPTSNGELELLSGAARIPAGAKDTS